MVANHWSNDAMATIHRSGLSGMHSVFFIITFINISTLMMMSLMWMLLVLMLMVNKKEEDILQGFPKFAMKNNLQVFPINPHGDLINYTKLFGEFPFQSILNQLTRLASMT